ncbi:MAG: HEAT repeat domain-containing protein [Planctomycetes bacterium]|nr:HEAT repeat domain-containing protein [Planctomycetota bacterium]MCB9825811.1 HEAT repeat domain-containing protein [Planctomycetota bacterium]MCB9829096.1 HEAT repeat domain-containing protein [Planctomycetota bacterium]MCB9901210.1 HEAT repeat domain-containing protein [Planctomycetota bacterium]
MTARPRSGSIPARLAFGLALAAAMLAGHDARDAHAHGGNIVAPPPPPEPKEPPIPVPPPAPITRDGPITPPSTPPGPPPVTRGGPITPPTKPPPTTPDRTKPGTPPTLPPTGGTPPPSPPTTGGPARPGTGGPTPPGRGPTTRNPRGATAPTAAAPWSLWWTFNRLAWLPDRDALAKRRASNVTPRDDAQDEAAQRDEIRRRTIVPWLLRTLADPRTEPEIAAASLLALAKLSNDALALATIDRYLRDAPGEAVVAESAALAAGLLRRSDAGRQATAAQLDAVRDRLFEIIDTDHRRWRTRAFAALSLGLLADQPGGGPPGHEGARTARSIWARLETRPTHPELDIALITALGMQPASCVPTRVREGLKEAVLGRRVGGRRWADRERAHAVTAHARFRAPGWATWSLRVAIAPRVPSMVRQAAVVALGAGAEHVSPEDREEIARSFPRVVDRASEPAARGLVWVTAGQLIRAERQAGHDMLDNDPQVGRKLRNAAENAQADERALAAVGLALAHAGSADQAPTGALLRERFATDPGGPWTRAAYAVGLLLLGDETAAPGLLQGLKDSGTDPALRATCALALGVLGQADEATRHALATAVFDRSAPEVAGEAALALSMLPRGSEGPLLAGRLDDRASEHTRARIAVALGRLGDVRTVDQLLGVASGKRHGDETRALAVAALGLLADPEAVPSLVRLARDAPYMARTDALHEALDIL